MVKDINFYNRESKTYSSKRYPKTASTYVQFFFKKRLSVVIGELKKLFEKDNGLSLLEVGCADGIVLREIDLSIGDKFQEMFGIDTAPNMIMSAKASVSNPKIKFFVRGEEPVDRRFDVVLEVGVANYTNFEVELLHAKERMKENGVYILSIAGNNSSNAYFGRGIGYENFLSYAEYENKIKKYFTITSVHSVGMFVPFIWVVPFLARYVQPTIECLFRALFPNLFHEKVYILRPR